MQLLDLCEPGQTPQPHENDKTIAVGIDLGTTNSLVAFSDNQQPKIMRDAEGGALLPSIVAYLENGQKIVGHRAALEPTAIRSVKRLMGRGFGDIKKIAGKLPFDISMLEEDMGGIVRLNVGDKTVTPIEVSAEILRVLKERAEASLGEPVTKAVITVPAYFDDAARNATKDAAKLAGLDVLRLVNEPTAAALAYGLDHQSEGIYAVYDLGGGTFDISLLRMEKGVFQVLATAGDAQLGGDDFDAAIAENILEQFALKHHAPELSTGELQSILTIARTIKEALTLEKSYQCSCNINGIAFEGNFSRNRFDALIAPFIQHTIDIAATMLRDADIDQDQVQGVVMVGGSTRIPAIYAAVEKLFGKAPFTNVNPDEVVVLGAALQAENLTGGSGHLLLDVTPLSLGLEIMGGMNEKIIQRNTPIPVSVVQEFTTYKDGQTGLQIHIVQGEREMVEDCRSLAHFELTGIPPMKAGVARIKLAFIVDADGLLTVSATEETTGAHQEIAVKPSYGLRDGEIETMLRDSMENARHDIERRLLAESRTEAERTIIAIEQALKEDGALLEAREITVLEKQIINTRTATAGSNRDQISRQLELLESAAEPLVSKQLNVHLGKALEGLTVEQLEKFSTAHK